MNKSIERDKNIGVRVGDQIIHKNCEFVIVDIRCDEGAEGAELYIRAVNPNRAAIEQQKKIKMEQASSNVLDMIKKASEGGFSGMGFGIGG